MRKYPKYKASGIDWFGDIPEGWDIIKLKFLTSAITKGTTPSTVGMDFVDEGINYLKVESISDVGTILPEKCSFIDSETHKILFRSQLKERDIVISIAGAIGRVAIIRKDILPANTNQAVGIIRLRKKFNNQKWITYLLNSEPILNHYKLEVVETAQANLSLENVGIVELTSPSLPEQHGIVRFLDYKTKQIDSLIANRKKQIELLKEQKAGIINKAVTKGINPNAKMKDSGIEWIGKVPEHWTVSKLKFVASIFGRIGFRGYTINDLVEKGEGAITISPSNMKADQMDFSSCTYISWFKHEESPEIKIFNGDILFVKTGSTYGKISLVENLNEPATINPQILVFKKIKTNTLFFYHQLRSKLIQAHVKTSVIGGTIPTISQEKIGNYYFLLPSNEEQEKITEHIRIETKIIDELVSKYHKQIDLMQEYRTSLISQAVTGKIDVREWQPKQKQKYE